MFLNRLLTLVVIAIPCMAQFAGPAILSRGEAPAEMVDAPISFRPYLDVTTVYTNGLAGLAVTDQGALAATTGYGVEVAGGIAGFHMWRHTRVGLQYRGALRHYSQGTYSDYSDQSLLLGVIHQFSRHATFSLQQSAGMSTLPTGLPGLASTVPFDPSITYRPNTDFFDNRTVFAVTQADFVLQKSARLSFDVGGAGFLNRFRSTALYGVTGASARGDVQYRVGRRTTIGTAYAFNHFSFNRVLSSTDYHTFSGTLASRLSKRLEISAYGGVGRAETKIEQGVPIDPVIAALLGVSHSSQIVHSIIWTPNVNARLSRTFHHGVAYVSGGRTITPGNGLFLTSKTNTVLGGVTYTGVRHSSLTTQVQYMGATSIGNILGNYADVSAGISATREIRSGVSALLAVNATQYQSGSFVNYNHLIFNVSAGLRISTESLPLRVW